MPKDKKSPRKQSLFDRIITIICIIILVYCGINEFSHLYKPEKPMAEMTTRFSKHYSFDIRPPFVMAYYMLEPQNVQPGQTYPLIVNLHGTSGNGYQSRFLADDPLYSQIQAYVISPMAPKRSFWATPDNKDYRLVRRGPGTPDSIHQVVSIVKEMSHTYPIDPQRIYITGHSMGGQGVYGALKEYPDIFAAGIVTAGLWDPAEAPLINKVPLVVFHGTHDAQIPVANARLMAEGIKYGQGHVEYFELPRSGHGIWQDVYSTPAIWSWLLQIKKPPSP